MADTLNVIIAGAIGQGEFQNYAATDKLMDTYYLTFAGAIPQPNEQAYSSIHTDSSAWCCSN